MFLALGNKWRREPMGGQMMSPDYQDVDTVIRRLKIGDGDQAFEDYLAMEGAALRAFSEKE